MLPLPHVSLLPMVIVFVVLLAGLGALVVALVRHGGNQGAADAWRLSSKRWAVPAQLRRAGQLVSARSFWADGLEAALPLGWIGGGMATTPRHGSLLVVAPPGARKTSAVVVPAVLRYAGPVLCASVKSEVYELTSEHRAGLGRVIVFDPSGATGIRSCRWSPLMDIRSYASAQQTAFDLLRADKASEGQLENQHFWDVMGRQGLAPLLYCAARTGRGIGECSALLLDEQDVTQELVLLGDQTALTQWQLHIQQEPRTKANINSTILQVLEVWSRTELQPILRTGGQVGPPAPAPILPAQPQLMRELLEASPQPASAATEAPAATEQPAWDAEQPANQPSGEVLDLDRFVAGHPGGGDTLFLVAPAQEQEQYAPVFQALISAVVRRIEQRSAQLGGVPLDPSILLCIDEAANIAPIKDLHQLVSRLRGQGAQIITVWQSLAQLYDIYHGDRAEAVIAGHTSKLFLSGIDEPRTLRYLSDAVGQDWHREVSTTSSPTGGSSTAGMHLIDVAPADWLRTRPAREGICLTPRVPPARLHLPAYFEDKRLQKMIPQQVLDRYRQVNTHGKRQGARGKRQGARR